MEIKFAKKRDVIIIAVLLLAALIIWAIYAFFKPEGNLALVSIGYGNNMTTQKIMLNKDKTYHIDAKLPVTLVVEDGTIRFVNPQCPDRLCEGFGRIKNEDEFAACLPSEVVVKIVTADSGF